MKTRPAYGRCARVRTYACGHGKLGRTAGRQHMGVPTRDGVSQTGQSWGGGIHLRAWGVGARECVRAHVRVHVGAGAGRGARVVNTWACPRGIGESDMGFGTR